MYDQNVLTEEYIPLFSVSMSLECAKPRKFQKPDWTRKSGYIGFRSQYDPNMSQTKNFRISGRVRVLTHQQIFLISNFEKHFLKVIICTMKMYLQKNMFHCLLYQSHHCSANHSLVDLFQWCNCNGLFRHAKRLWRSQILGSEVGMMSCKILYAI